VKTAFRWWTIVWPVLVVVQITLVGVGAFHAAKVLDDDKALSKDSFENWFAPHAAFGSILVLLAILYGLFSLGTRDRRLMKIGGITAGLFILQMLLAWLGGGIPALGWLHPLNALVILGYTGRNSYAAWRERTAVETAPAAAAPAA
jgi:hypothetical membrane protein